MWLVNVLGVIGTAIFFGRFYVQWIVSEIKKESTFPVLFWYMSSVGSLMLFIYSVSIREPVGALSYSFNIIVYARNLVHIWRNKGVLTPLRSILLHGAVGLIAVGALVALVLTWWWEIEATKSVSVAEGARNWFWIAVGAAGSVMFAGRFVIQWIATERKRESVIPVAFWYLSLGATVLQALSYSNRGKWLLAAGVSASIIIYLRNLWLIHRNQPVEPDSE
ncbi:MAG: lipid-A-disaccharide synthase N-terminal domain-containing protein [Candidatus Hydrogenedentes bacterium]|nr:lipid-A-disaccharide synthase N-terminal domain-containing protein [Candidatus Hydrogenedentota bacterium]